MKHKLKFLTYVAWIIVIINAHQLTEKEPVRDNVEKGESITVIKRNTTEAPNYRSTDLHSIQVAPGIQSKPHQSDSVNHPENEVTIGTPDNVTANVTTSSPRRNSRGPIDTTTTTNVSLSESSRSFDPPYHNESTNKPPNKTTKYDTVSTTTFNTLIHSITDLSKDLKEEYAANLTSSESSNTAMDTNDSLLKENEDKEEKLESPNNASHSHPEVNSSHHEGHRHLDDFDPSSTQDLCLACFCDVQRKKVYCKHEHVYDGKSHHLTLNMDLIPKNATFLHLEGFDTVTIPPHTFSSENLELRQILFEDIGEVILTTGSLSFSERAREHQEVVIVFRGCKIEKLPSETFTQHTNTDNTPQHTRFLSLYFDRCEISTIHSHALYQARVWYFNMTNTKVGKMEEDCINFFVIESWIIENCELPHFKSHTITLHSLSAVVFSKNIMQGLDSRALDIISSNQVLFKYNKVKHLAPEALLGIQPDDKAISANIVFLNNTVERAENKSLLISDKYPIHERRVLENKFNLLCDCEINGKFQGLLGITERSNYFENATYQAVLDESLCLKYENLFLYVNIDKFLNDNCSPIPLPIIISTAVVAFAVIITVIVCVVCSRRASRAREEANYLGDSCFSNSFSNLHSIATSKSPPYGSECHSWERCNNLQPWVMAVPEVKTYQETEVHVLYEHTEPMNVSIRGSYPDPRVELLRQPQTRASCPFN